MGRLLRFELQVPDPEQAIRFYSTCFNWKFDQIPGHDYWLITTGESDRPGIDGGLIKSPDGAVRTINSIEVDSVDDYLVKIEKNGGKVVVPKTSVPGMGYFAYCIDSQGLLFGVSEVDPGVR
ncbi:VOC family protein [Paenibacillus spongiae]|uniref:VOC family protein n=1 Tax=Paenibacillus spongiae TaxID=2909671 RepID=A0ABY5SMD5_9BACL|nr:VOC family protein [Paenibacillus spongiae]UVI33388.1 VOC family protein [Paenibacillus spongiae]